MEGVLSLLQAHSSARRRTTHKKICAPRAYLRESEEKGGEVETVLWYGGRARCGGVNNTFGAASPVQPYCEIKRYQIGPKGTRIERNRNLVHCGFKLAMKQWMILCELIRPLFEAYKIFTNC